MGADLFFSADTFTKTDLKREPPKIYRDGSIGLGANDPLFQFRDDAGPKRSEKYEEVGVLGTGSYGQAVLVRRKSDGQKMVVKQIKIHGLTFEQRRDARNEVEVLSKLDHPNIVRYHECFLESGILQIVMEFAEEGDMYGRIQQRAQAGNEPFSEDQVMFWFVQICLALKHVHSKRMLHRDLKTQNIFCAAHDIIKLGDFGIAKVLSSDGEMAKTVIGTPYYLSPEICEDKPYDKKSDVWSLGCVLYEMVTLKHAFDGQSLPALIMKILRGKYPPIPPAYSANLKNLIASMLKRDRKHRPSIEKILSLPFVRGSIERYCDHIQRYIISQGATDNGLQESLTQDANQGEEGLSEGLGRGLEADLSGGVGAGLGPLDGSLEAIKEGAMEGTAFGVVLDKRTAEIGISGGERPASPGSDKLAKARALARQKSAGRNQEWLAKQAEQLHALAQQTQQLSPAANLSTRSSLNRASSDAPPQRPIRDLFAELVEEQLSALPSPSGASGRPHSSPPSGKRPPGGKLGARAALQVGAAVRKARATRGQVEAAERQKKLESASRKFLKGADSPGSRPASRDANALRKKSVEEPKKATKPKPMSRDEKERQKRLQDQEKRRMKEADLLRAQATERQNRKEDLIRQQAERRSAREAELQATKQHLQRHRESLRQAKPRLNKQELIRQFSSGPNSPVASPGENLRPGDFPGHSDPEFSLRGSDPMLTISKTGVLGATSKSTSLGQTSPKPLSMSETLKSSPYGKSQRRALSAGGGFARGNRGDSPPGRSRKVSPEDLPVEIYVRGYTGPVSTQDEVDKFVTSKAGETNGGVESGRFERGEEQQVMSSSWRKVKGGVDLIAVLHTMQHYLGTHKGPLSEEEEAPPPGPDSELGVIEEAEEEGSPFSTMKTNRPAEYATDGQLSKAGGVKASEDLLSPGLQIRTKAEAGKGRVATLLSESGVPMSPITPMIGDGARSAMGAKIEALREMCEKHLGEEVFLRVYKYLRDVQQSEEDSTVQTQSTLESLLNQDQLPLVRHVYKLVMYEDDFYNHGGSMR